jgi:hypothetical protein
MRYLQALNAEDYLPSFRVDFLSEGLGDDRVWIQGTYLLGLDKFLETHSGNKFVAKTPCTTHGSLYSSSIYCDDRETVHKRICSIIRRSQHSSYNPRGSEDIEIPYLFVQVRAPSNREDKVLLLGGPGEDDRTYGKKM